MASATAAASSSSGCNRGRAVLPVTAFLVPFLLLVVVSCQAALVVSATHRHGHGGGKHATAGATARAAFRAGDEREAYARIMARMARMDKDSNMTIQVPSLPCSCSCSSAPAVRARCRPVPASGQASVQIHHLAVVYSSSFVVSRARVQSPDGDVIHCVPAHLQPAFDHPRLRGQKPEVSQNLLLYPASIAVSFCICSSVDGVS